MEFLQEIWGGIIYMHYSIPLEEVLVLCDICLFDCHLAT
jgi:hypothetical protein